MDWEGIENRGCEVGEIGFGGVVEGSVRKMIFIFSLLLIYLYFLFLLIGCSFQFEIHPNSFFIWGIFRLTKINFTAIIPLMNRHNMDQFMKEAGLDRNSYKDIVGLRTRTKTTNVDSLSQMPQRKTEEKKKYPKI